MKELFILTTKDGLNDIVWWDKDIVLGEVISTYGLFKNEKEAEKYKKYIEKTDDIKTPMFVRKIKISLIN